MKRWIISIAAIVPLLTGLVFVTLHPALNFQSPISPPPTPTFTSPVSPPPTPTLGLPIPSRTPRPTATPSVEIHEWYEDCPLIPTPWPVQPTLTPAPTPTCYPLLPNPSPTPYPTATPYPTQPRPG